MLMRSGLCLPSAGVGAVWHPRTFVLPSPDGASLFYVKSDNPAIFRVGKSGLNEELVYKPQDNSWLFVPLLLFPGGKDLLAGAFRRNMPNGHIFRISLTSHEAVDLGDMPVGSIGDVAWAEPGNSILISRTVNGLTNIWKYSLQDRSLTQITFGTGEGLLAYARPRWERNLFFEWQTVRVSNRVSRTVEGIDEHCIGGCKSTHHFAGWEARDVHHVSHIRKGRTLDV